MIAKIGAVLIALLVTSCSSGPSELPEAVQEHNKERTAVSSPALKWSSELAKAAQSWADQCKFEHSPSSAGENLYVTSSQSISAKDAGVAAVQSWAAEKSDYNLATNTCASGRVCGHYTQMIWKSTTEVGCAVTSCSSIQGFQAGTLVVCQYTPAGNVVGQSPVGAQR